AVAVLGTLYAAGGESEAALIPILQNLWTIPMGLSFLAFFVFSPSCFATLAAIKREMGSWKAPFFLWLAYTLLAYAFSFAVYRLALLVV
ncbi:MAG: nucleoside recognition domain-containing protein, partial [Sutterella sp.]|nr:nucleoside recognition domain-containing protein [Sutterella sp.]